jgi:uncharacterized SAM-binding protein YcdF (DUF218 family)
VPESRAVAEHIQEFGIDPRRLTIEDRSRTTAENATEAARLLKPRPGQRWLLVTSAFHMPRAVGLFRHAGFDVVAIPTDYRTRPGGTFTFASTWVSEGLLMTDIAVKEWIGLLAAWLSGASADLFPAPRPKPSGDCGQ